MKQDNSVSIIEPTYFSNWADQWFPKIANKVFLPIAKKITWLSPNMVTILSFVLYTTASLLLFVPVQNHLIFSAFLLPLSYILDCLDGQLARSTNRSSAIGDYLDKTLDVLKIYMVTLSLAIATFIQTGNVLYIFLGFTACFFFNFRYYIKLETMFNTINKDPEYLKESRKLRLQLYVDKAIQYKNLKKTPGGKLSVLWYKNRIFFFVDEAEFVVVTAIGAVFNQLELALIFIAVSQIIIAFWRLFERGYQLHTNSPRLLWPMRK